MRIKIHLPLQKTIKAITTLCFLALPTCIPNAAQAQLEGTFSGLGEFAKKVVIGIETSAASGSGVIIGRLGSEGAWTYYFLTAKHVANGNPENEEFLIFSKSGNNTSREKVSAFIHPPEFKEIDLAVGSFKSKNIYQIAPIFALGTPNSYVPFRGYNGKAFNDSEKIQGGGIVAGVSIPTASITVPVFRLSNAAIQDRAPGNKDGYEMLYISPSTVPGMSGGGVFGARICPDERGAYAGLLAIHGRSEGYRQSGSRSGTSLGIPLDSIKTFLENAKYIPSGKNYELLVEELCGENSFY